MMIKSNKEYITRFKIQNGFDVSIRKMTVEDLDKVYELEKKVYPDPWSFSHFQYEICSNKVSYLIVAESEQLLLGYAVAWFIEDEVHIANIAIDHEYRKLGIASRLIIIFFEEACNRNLYRVFLEVRENNLAAIQLYHKFGFESVGLRRNYYRTGENAIVMQRFLPNMPDSTFAFAST